MFCGFSFVKLSRKHHCNAPKLHYLCAKSEDKPHPGIKNEQVHFILLSVCIIFAPNLLIGFVLLIKGADFFVEGSSSLAKILKVPSVIIGLTIVAMGTSAPEASVSINAALSGSNDIAISNVVGNLHSIWRKDSALIFPHPTDHCYRSGCMYPLVQQEV